ncbi:MAG: crotonase/enoyl-CoA hydratase family protein [Myxococcota bacterium]
MSEHVHYAMRDSIAELTLDDGKVNAMSQPFFAALNAALDQAEKDEARAVVLTGRPGVFSAGLNLKLLPTLSPEEIRDTLIDFGNAMLRVYTFPIPTLAAVSGHAIAGGFVLMSACDLRLVAGGPHRIHLNEVAIGLTLPTWAILIAQSATPPRWHTEAILHARLYTPEEALDRGIIDRIVTSAEDLGREALAAAAGLAALDTKAYAVAKTRMREPGVNHVRQFIERDASVGKIG